ncbi:btb/poz domain-containing protein [Anaeramoeba flamelloides]|uniref:Btb/poz domain-containing protein n=1 Tax=Anaeramoeba flamelloides TaxID=1746091 RepID=A0ABQ8X2W6_9EUKA|nr:btb/poz domain-containing protein [Anaeramoeba flamelloides]
MIKRQIYVSGSPNDLSFLVDPNQSNLPHFSLVTKIKGIHQIKKIVIGSCWQEPNLLVWKTKSLLELYQKDKPTKQFTIENDSIKEVQSGFSNYLILTKSGKVYSLADSKNCIRNEIPFTDPKKSTFNELRPVIFSNEKENSRKVKSIAMTGWRNYYLFEDGTLYGNGLNNGGLGDGTNTESKNPPVFIFSKVSRAFGGVQASNMFFITEENELYVCGDNQGGGLGTGNRDQISTPKQVTNFEFEVSDVLDIYVYPYHSLLITNEGEVYTCGSGGFNGLGEEKFYFTRMEQFKDKKVIKINGGDPTILLLTSENELYGCNFDIDKHPTDEHKNQLFWNKPLKINLPFFNQKFSTRSTENNFEIQCGTNTIFIYPKYKNSLYRDFENLFKSQKYFDSQIIIKNKKNLEEVKIPVHKLILELRTNLKLNEIRNIITKKEFSKKEIDIFLKWVYLDEYSNAKTIEKIFNSLNLHFPPPKNSLKKDLLKLFHSEKLKDFAIAVKKKNKNKEGNIFFENIPIHKLILLTRSGLFRDMFENLNEKEKEIQKIRDYTGKSSESLKILFKYFYTNRIEFMDTQGYNMDLIYDELEDAFDYYQLNECSDLLEQLKRLKRKKSEKQDL